MPNCYHGFARHNGYEPPPQFPGASLSPGIVHYLSGHSMHAPRCSQDTHNEVSVWCEPGACETTEHLNTVSPSAQQLLRAGQIRLGSDRAHECASPPSLAFTLPAGFVEPLDLHTCYTPWPVFRDVTDRVGHITYRSGEERRSSPLTKRQRHTARAHLRE